MKVHEKEVDTGKVNGGVGSFRHDKGLNLVKASVRVR